MEHSFLVTFDCFHKYLLIFLIRKNTQQFLQYLHQNSYAMCNRVGPIRVKLSDQKVSNVYFGPPLLKKCLVLKYLKIGDATKRSKFRPPPNGG